LTHDEGDLVKKSGFTAEGNMFSYSDLDLMTDGSRPVSIFNGSLSRAVCPQNPTTSPG